MSGIALSDADESPEEVEMVMDWTRSRLLADEPSANKELDTDDASADSDAGDWMAFDDLEQAIRDYNDPDDDIPTVVVVARNLIMRQHDRLDYNDQIVIVELLFVFDTRLAMLRRERDNIDARIEIALKRDVRRHRHNRKLYYPDYGHRRGFHLDQHPRHDTVTY